MPDQHFALVVEWTVPDDADHHAALLAMVAKIHADSPAPAENVTAYVGVSAELIGHAARTGQVVDQSERLHLETGDHVVVTIKPDQADTAEDLQRWADLAREAFPDHEIVVAWEGTTVAAQPSAKGEASA